MLINYRLTDGMVVELEVSEEVGRFYLESVAAKKKNDRRNSRADRNTSLDAFTYEDARFFGDSSDLLADLIQSENISSVMACLNERQQYLIKKAVFEGWSYTDLAALEGKDESAIRHAVGRAKKKLVKMLK
jgi:RNA polymerase sigma-70 factor (ECF subfamily)